MKEYFQKLYKYNEWANRRVLGAIERQNVTTEKILSIFSHQLVANFLWLHRIKGLPAPDLKLWQTYDLPKLRELVDEGSKQWIEFVESTDSFNRVLKYKNYVGDYYETNVEHIMMHLVNHGTYHRGQLVTMLRQLGVEDIPSTDFSGFIRLKSKN